MRVDRYMVNLFFEIRRGLPSAVQSELKLSSPSLSNDLIETYKKSEDENTRLLIERFFERAGDDHIKLIRKVKAQKVGKTTRFYRGVPIK